MLVLRVRGCSDMTRRQALPVASPAPTIRTVASLAGVGVGTVSRVLNGGPVSSLARDKVNHAIKELGFFPMTAARGLATRKTSTVGLVVNSTRGSWFSELLAGVEQALSVSRRSVLLASLRLTGEYDSSAVEAWVQERRVDGILFVRSSRRERGLIHAARNAGLPIALIAPDEQTQADVIVGCNNDKGGELLATHLAQLGHERFAFVGGPSGSRDTRDRLRGFLRGLQQMGRSLPRARFTFAASYYAEAARPDAQRFLNMPESARPTAVVLASDAMALGFIKVLLEGGVRVPDDVSIAGFDGVPDGELYWPALTTVAQPTRRMAQGACEALLNRIDGRTLEPDIRRHEVELIVRGSCAPPRNV